MLLATLAEVSNKLSATRGRLAKVRLLADCLRALEPGERETGVLWLSGLLPGGRLGLGYAAVRDLRGITAASQPTLTLGDARARLDGMRDITGKGSAARRQEALAGLFAAATAPEQDFLARLLLGELRQGALQGVMVDAVAQAAEIPAADVRRAAMLAGGVAPVALAALDAGAAGLAAFRLRLFEPLGPMLASPTDDVASALDSLGAAVFDWKLDGARAQIHKEGGRVCIYSRNGRDVTFSLPEIEAAVARLPAHSLILDGEVIALHPDGRPRPFQDTMRRFGRKLDVAGMSATLPMSLFCFDCLHHAGEELIDRPLRERLAFLDRAVPAALRAPRLLTSSHSAAHAFLEDALHRGHEGVMAKAPEALYEAGSRGASWLKIKVAHTLDLVVLAAEWGSGRRRGWLSNLHLGARRDDGQGFVMLGKTFKGLTDELLAWQTERLRALAVKEEGHVVWVKPELVVEIAFNELQASPRYPGGLALRFARVLRYREDKRAEEADTMATVRAIATNPKFLS